jgi:hypothetical protein
MAKKQYLQASDRSEAIQLYGNPSGATDLIYHLFECWAVQKFKDANGKPIPKDWDLLMKDIFLRKGIEFKKSK